MPSFKYQSWEDRLYQALFPDSKLTADGIESYKQQIDQPDIDQFLDHQDKQVAEAISAGASYEGEVRELQFATLNARRALELTDTTSLAMAFIRLGKAIRAMEMPSNDTIVKGLSAIIEKHKREKPLQDQAFARNMLQEAARRLAELYWKNDRDQTIRTTEMSEKIWPHLKDLAAEQNVERLLADTKQVKEWIKPVAPMYAQQGGRPRKK